MDMDMRQYVGMTAVPALLTEYTCQIWAVKSKRRRIRPKFGR